MESEEKIIKKAVMSVAKDWEIYGTPNRSQCAKIAQDAIDEYKRLLNTR